MSASVQDNALFVHPGNQRLGLVTPDGRIISKSRMRNLVIFRRKTGRKIRASLSEN